MKQISKLAVLVLAIAMLSVFVIAAKEDGTETTTDEKTTGAKNMTYGQCISEAAKVRNTCYDTSKATADTCKSNAGEDSKATKACNTAYKNDKNQCKQAFKNTKKQECGKIKHNFMESIKASFI